jgi:hypothetical protein
VSCVDGAPGSLCPVEQICHHHSGLGAGPGTVLGGERLLFAVFGSTERTPAKLIGKDFPSKDLKKGDLSLARLSHTSWAVFRDSVVASRPTEKLLGISEAEANRLRQLIAEFRRTNETIPVRAVCVLDKVEVQDHDGHAALKFCAGQQDLPNEGKSDERNLGTMRTQISAELANIFSEIRQASFFYQEANDLEKSD